MRFYDALTEFIFVEDQPEQADYIFIPGSGYGELAEKAAEIYHKGFSGKIVVSGKYSVLGDRFTGPVSPEKYVGKEYETECDFLADILRESGVPSESVLLEKSASYTYENAIYTRRLLGEEKIEKVILVCQAYHARRSLLYYQLLFPDTKFYVCPAKTRGIAKDNWFLSPEKIDVVLGEVERCGSQFHEIMKLSIASESQE
ncbi:MAG: YdcF family protein [Eubacteriales bacterium]|nr:YdcF family protein [Eubacteriales bacterium]